MTGKVDDKDVYKDWETLGKKTWDSDADLSATWYAGWDANTFYFAALVKDDKHENKQTGAKTSSSHLTPPMPRKILIITDFTAPRAEG